MGELTNIARGGGSASGSGGSGYAPRASDIVYRAIDHATRLAQSGQYKAAADILQHAHDVGTREDHRPRNLDKLPALAGDLRAKFLAKFPPRPPQDNARTGDEEAVLRQSGKTTRLLLFEWDSADEGYPAENVWMPGRLDQAFADGFVPTLAPEQAKAQPRFVRFEELVAAQDRFSVLVGEQSGETTEQSASSPAAPGGDAATARPADPTAALASPPTTATDGAAAPAATTTAAAPAATTTATATPLCLLKGLPDPMSIRQTVVSDCSLVCSLIVTAHYERRFPGARLIRSAMYPQDDAGEPVLNP